MKQIDTSKKRISKVISILIAILVWVFVIHAENPSMDITINTIDIQLLRENTLTDKELMVVDKGSVPDASIVIRGKRQDLISVMGNITANVDLSQFTEAGVYKIQPNFDIPSNAVYIAKRNTGYIQLNIEEMVEKTVPVQITVKNADKNKSFIVDPIPENNMITVKGAYADISLIDHARISIDASSLTHSVTDMYPYVFEDENNSEILPINKLYADEKITVINNVYDKTTLNLTVTLPSSIKNKYTVKLLSQDKEKIEVGIKSSDGQYVQSITNTSDFDMITPGTNKYKLSLVQPNGIYIPEENMYVTVELEVFEKAEKNIDVPLNVKNSGNKTYSLEKNTVSVSISGPSEKLKSNNVNVELDLDKLSGTGEQTVKLKPTTSEKDITIEDTEVFVNITIEE